MRHPLYVSLVIAVAAIATSGCGSSKTVTVTNPTEMVVAEYGGHKMTIAEFERRYEKSVGGRDEAVQDSMAEYVDFLERYVDFRLKVMEAEQLGLDRDPDLVSELQQYRTQLARPYLVEQQVTDTVVQNLWERQQEEITASHILVRIADTAAPEDTLAAYERIRALADSVEQGADFGDIAYRNSDDQSAKRNRGFLGTFTGGRMIKAFEDRAYSTTVGEMSPIFRTRFGYHVLYVSDRQPRTPDIRASHILLRHSPEDSTQALSGIQEIERRLASGELFEDLARELSEDPGSASQGGDLGAFGRGRMVKPFEDAAFALDSVGAVSAPVETRFGYHLIKLTGVEDLPSFDEAYEELKTLAKRLPRTKEREDALGRKYRMDLGSSIDSVAVRSVLASFPPDSAFFALYATDQPDSLQNTAIATISDSSYSVSDLVDYARTVSSRPAKRTEDQIFDLIEAMLNAGAIDIVAASLEDRDDDFRELMQEYRDGIVLFRIMEDSVWNRASQDTVGLEAHYAAHQEKYWFPERLRVVSFTASTDSTLKEATSLWPSESDTVWAAFHESDSRFRIDTTFIADTTNSVYDRALGLEEGEVTDPIPYRRAWIALAASGREEPRQKTFEEARAEVIGEYQERIEEEWVRKLRTSYEAKTYPDRLIGAFKMPTADADTDAIPEADSPSGTQ